MSEKFKSTKKTFDTGNGEAVFYSVPELKNLGYSNIDKLPFSIKILLEAVLRENDGYAITDEDIETLATYNAAKPEGEIPFKPSRVVPSRLYRSTRSSRFGSSSFSYEKNGRKPKCD